MIRYAVFNRTAIRAAVLFAALGGVQIACAQTVAFDAFMGKVVGNNTTVTFGTGGTPLVTSSAGLGTPTVGNMGLSQSGSGVTVGGNVRVPLGDTGKAAAAVGRAAITRAAFLRGIASAAGGPVGIALLAAPAVLEWLSDNELGLYVGDIDPNKPFMIMRKQKELICKVSVNYPPPAGLPAIGSSSSQGCGGLGSGTVYLDTFASPNGSGITCEVRNSCHSTVLYKAWGVSGEIIVTPTPSSYEEALVQVESLGRDLSKEAVKQAIEAGVNPFGDEYAKPNLTGPSEVAGAKSETSTQTRVHPGTTTEVAPGANVETQPATKTTTKTETHKVTYNGNQASYTTNVTTNTTITNNVTGDTITNVEETKTENDAKPEEKEQIDLCEKHPDILACRKPDFDTPDGEVPKSNFDVTYQAENAFGGGSCPADLYANINGQQMMVWDWKTSCGYIAGYMRPVILVICSFVALMIIMPAKT